VEVWAFDRTILGTRFSEDARSGIPARSREHPKSKEHEMETRRFGRKLRLPATIAIKHQIRKLMFEDAVKAEAKERAEAIDLQPQEARSRHEILDTQSWAASAKVGS
jgi:hypothetical protein